MLRYHTHQHPIETITQRWQPPLVNLTPTPQLSLEIATMYLPLFITARLLDSVLYTPLRPGEVKCKNRYTPVPAEDVVKCNEQIIAKGNNECVVDGVSDYDIFCEWGRANVGARAGDKVRCRLRS